MSVKRVYRFFMLKNYVMESSKHVRNAVAWCKPGAGNLRPAMADMARIRIFVTQLRIQNPVKANLHDKQLLRLYVIRSLYLS